MVNTPSIKTVLVKVTDLKPSEYNPRYWSEKAISDLKKSIRENGFVIPILANGNKSRYGVVIAGHFRLKIAKDLGYKVVPVNFIDISDIEKERKLNLTLNRVVGDWDFELLKNFDIETLMDIGFDNNDLSKIWDENLETYEDDFDTQAEIEKIKVPKTKLGDIIKLGPHLLVCGNSMDLKVVQRLTSEKMVSMAYFDPPFNIGLDYNKGVGGKGKYGGKTDDNKTDLGYREFLKRVIENGLAISKPDVHVFIWNDERHIGLIQDLYKEIGIENKRVCLWIKNGFSPTPNVAFNKSYEACIYGTIGKPSISENPKNLNEILNKEIGSGNRTIDDILDLLNIWLVKRLPGSEYSHPTEKSPTLHEKAIRRCTKVGDTVLDLFAGSGSTMCSCEQLKRKCLMVEIEPIFCDLIISRFTKLTGKEVTYVN
ncbi:MAG: DNA modification methylase [Candidatus Shapirobacteria bacterium]|jgi:DNA modification methylase